MDLDISLIEENSSETLPRPVKSLGMKIVDQAAIVIAVNEKGLEFDEVGTYFEMDTVSAGLTVMELRDICNRMVNTTSKSVANSDVGSVELGSNGMVRWRLPVTPLDSEYGDLTTNGYRVVGPVNPEAVWPLTVWMLRVLDWVEEF